MAQSNTEEPENVKAGASTEDALISGGGIWFDVMDSSIAEIPTPYEIQYVLCKLMGLFIYSVSDTPVRTNRGHVQNKYKPQIEEK